MHLDTREIVGALAEPRLISSQSSSAKGPPPLNTIFGLNLSDVKEGRGVSDNGINQLILLNSAVARPESPVQAVLVKLPPGHLEKTSRPWILIAHCLPFDCHFIRFPTLADTLRANMFLRVFVY